MECSTHISVWTLFVRSSAWLHRVNFLWTRSRFVAFSWIPLILDYLANFLQLMKLQVWNHLIYFWKPWDPVKSVPQYLYMPYPGLTIYVWVFQFSRMRVGTLKHDVSCELWMVLDWIMIWLFAHVCLISLLLLLLYPCTTYNFGTRLTDRL